MVFVLRESLREVEIVCPCGPNQCARHDTDIERAVIRQEVDKLPSFFEDRASSSRGSFQRRLISLIFAGRNCIIVSRRSKRTGCRDVFSCRGRLS